MDRATFARLLEEHKDAVFGQALYLLGNRDDAEDVTQETFLSLWKERERVETDGARWWLLRVCRNSCLDQLRRRKVRRTARASEKVLSERGHVGIEREDEGTGERTLEVSDLGAGALHTELRVDVERLVGAMQQLKEPQRSIILLREVQDLSYDDIASELDLSLSAVKVYLHRARKKIRHAFEEERGAQA